jgi:hypothetical protein
MPILMYIFALVAMALCLTPAASGGAPADYWQKEALQ